ncbi:MAG: protein kinase [Planctomycetes bacterium]|nr:protein kinase [Planctomycetota bacterium]
MTGRPPTPSVPGWTILGRIGAGGMGSVWKARRADGAVAAVKVADGTTSSGAQFDGALFRRESLACLNLDHPNLVQGLDVGTTACGHPFLAMAFVDGPNLGRVVRDGGPLAESRVREIAKALARGLDHAHRLGLVHGDVKPSNVLLGRDGSIRLADLGLVSEAAVRAAGPVFATRAYAAPEVLGGAASSVRSDLFSLGATVAEALLGRLAVNDEQSWADAAVPAMSPTGVPIPDGLRAVVARLVRADPSRRYASAAELLLDLDALEAGDRPLGAILGASAAAIPRTAASRRRLALVAMGLIGVAVVVVVSLRVGDDSAPVAPPPEPAEPVATEDQRVVAVRFLIDEQPENYPRIRELLDQAARAGLDAAGVAAIEELRRSAESRAADAAAATVADRRARAVAAHDAGDVAGALAILRDWPETLRGSPFETELAALAATWRKEAERAAIALADEAESIAAAEFDGDRARRVLDRITPALDRGPFDGDQRARLAAARARIVQARQRSDAAIEEWAWRAAVKRIWGVKLTAAAAGPDAGVVALLHDPAAIPADLVEPAARVVEALDAAEARLLAACAMVRGRPWVGPLGNRRDVVARADAPTPEDVFLSPLWHIGDGRDDAIAAAAGGRRAAAAWLLAHGAWVRAASMDVDVAALVAGVSPLPDRHPERAPAALEAATRKLAFRADAGPPAESAPLGDAVADAWGAAAAGRASSTPAAARARAAAGPKSRGRDAFLADDVVSAWRALSEAASLDPWDAEIAVLRARILLEASRPLPTAPALVAAFTEGRRAVDLDPKLPAARELLADVGIALCALPAPDLVRTARERAAMACDDAIRVVRDDARYLAFVGRWLLDRGASDRGTELLRRAAVKSPDDGRILLDLARAEFAAGRKDRARDALRRATDAFRSAFPDDIAAAADDLTQKLAPSGE